MPLRDALNKLRRRSFVVPAVVYVVALLISAWKHTIWGDEGQAWLIARDSHTVLAVFRNVRYEGHPPLWHLVLWVVTRFTANPEWIKLPNILFAVASALIVLAMTKLPLLVRLGFVFSYYMMFEYSILNRNYMIGILLLLIAVTWIDDARRGLAVPFMLGLAALTSLPALIVAVCLYLVHLLAEFRDGKKRGELTWIRPAAFAGCVLGAALIIRPPMDSNIRTAEFYWGGGRKALHGLAECFHYVAEAFVPIPRLKLPFWNESLISQAPFYLVAVFGCVLAVALVLLFRSRIARSFFVGTNLLLLAELYVTGQVRMRHVGWLFVVFLLSLVLETTFMRDEDVAAKNSWRTVLLAGLMAAQVMGAVVALDLSWRYPFSSNKAVVAYLREQHLENAPLIAPEVVGNALLPYLQRRSLYSPERHGQSSFIVWNRALAAGSHVPSREDMVAAGNGDQPVLVTYFPLTKTQSAELNVSLRASFTGGTCRDDAFYIYR